MATSSPAAWLAGLTALAALSAGAQPASQADPSSAQPNRLSYRSALEGYKPFADEKPVPWRAANEAVYRRGGWRAYARESGSDAPPTEMPGKADAHVQHHSMPAAKEKP